MSPSPEGFVVELRSVRRVFGSTVAVDDVSLGLGHGEIFGLLGPSGCGKTTLLRLIAGLETPDSGTIHFGDRAVHTLRPHERRVAFVTQRSALYPNRDAFGNIACGLEFGRERLAKAEISRRDVFYLFWSTNASKSKEVDKEWRLALELRGPDYIDPVPLESPKLVPPPAELAHKHFNDWTLMYSQ